MAMKSTKAIRINSTCTVFAGAELRDRLSLGDKREDIMAGLHRAIILRAMSILARSGGIRNEFTFTGGVAKNDAAVKALMPDDYKNNQVIFPPADILAKCEYAKFNPDLQPKYEEAFTRVRAA